MKYLKKFNESIDLTDLADDFESLLQDANYLICKFKNEDPSECDYTINPDDVIDELENITGELQPEAQKLIGDIIEIQNDLY